MTDLVVLVIIVAGVLFIGLVLILMRAAQIGAEIEDELIRRICEDKERERLFAEKPDDDTRTWPGPGAMA